MLANKYNNLREEFNNSNLAQLAGRRDQDQSNSVDVAREIKDLREQIKKQE